MAKIEVKTEKSPSAIGPYSQGVKFGEFLFLSGQLPLNLLGEIKDDVAEQTRQSLQNIKEILEEAGSGMNHVLKSTVYITDMNDFLKINQVYQEFFEKPYPARSCVEVSRLPKDAKVEIEVIAFIITDY